MIKYRPHCGSLADSMKGYKEFATITDMLKYIEDTSNGCVSMTDVSISESQGKDERIGWNSLRYISTKKYGCETFAYPQCIGMCDLGETEPGVTGEPIDVKEVVDVIKGEYQEIRKEIRKVFKFLTNDKDEE